MQKIFLLVIIVAGLSLSGCSLSAWRDKISDKSDKVTQVEEQKPVSNKLNLSGQNFKKVPDYVFNQVNLEELDISNNQINGAIQSQIGNLKNLKVLKANNNIMTGVPAEIGQLQNLKTLDLSDNQLTGLPNEMGNLKNLQTLNISGNNYSGSDLDVITQKLSSSTKIIK